MENMKLCEIHYLQGRHRQYREKVPESLKIQRKTQTAPCEDQNNGGEGGEIRAQKVEDLVTLLKRKRAEEPAPVKIKKAKKKKKKKKKLKRCDLNLELIRMVLKREVEKRNTPPSKKKKKVVVEEESDEDHDDLTRDLPNGRMAISSSSSQSLGNVGSNSASDVRVGADLGLATTTRRCFRSKNIEPMPVGTLQAKL
jgi:lysine-specific demethylase 3